MKTTLYGNGQDRNEFGIPKVAKETNFVHAIYKIKGPIPTHDMRQMAIEFKELHGVYPTVLHMAAPSNGTRAESFFIEKDLISLDIKYNAPETKVA